MNCIKYFSFYRKALTYWLVVFIISLVISLFNLIFNKNISSSLFNIFYFPGLIAVIFFGYHSMNFIEYKKQLKFKEIFKSNINDNSFKNIQVEIFQESFLIKLYKQNQEAKINIKPYIEEFETYKIGEDIILIGQVYDFGIFRRPLKPLVIKKGENAIDYKKMALIPKITRLELINKDLEIVFEKNIESIRKLIIKDYE